MIEKINSNYSFDPNYLGNLKAPRLTKPILLEHIKSFQKFERKSLFFLYSEYILKSHRNPFFSELINRGNITAIDGKGLQWANYIIKSRWNIFISELKFRIGFAGQLCKRIVFVINCIYNIFSGFYILFTKKNTFISTHNQVILGRDFAYDLLDIADSKNWKVVILGAIGIEVISKIKRLHPNINISTWNMDSGSPFMQDKSVITDFPINNLTNLTRKQKILNNDNLLEHFPVLDNCLEFLKENQFDLVLVAFGGLSGKQEFFIDFLKNKTSIKFTLAVGLGAAFDHMGAGAKESPSSEFLNGIGLEWLFRFIISPRRRVRVFDSIFMFWIYISYLPFLKETDNLKLPTLF